MLAGDLLDITLHVFLLGLSLKEESICASHCFLGRRNKTMVVSHDCSPLFSLELVIVTFAFILLSKLSPWLNLMSMDEKVNASFQKENK